MLISAWKVDCNNGKIAGITLWPAFQSTVFSGSGSQRLLPVCRPEKILQGKRFGSNEEVIAEAKAYFEAKDKLFYKKSIEMSENHWNECFILERNYVDEWSRILPKSDKIPVNLHVR